ncbi:hypothetical protein DOT_1955 [Desulfosporosinus sp. OT]|nr:hypothetical protein DOT_1955 [Desulfosporosinus sp. OT]
MLVGCHFLLSFRVGSRYRCGTTIEMEIALTIIKDYMKIIQD